MRFGLCLVVFLSSAAQTGAQDILVFGQQISGDIAAGASHTYTFTAAAGDVVAGPVELLGPDGRVQFLDNANGAVSGTRIKGFYLGGTASRRVGFAAPTSGNYQIRITAIGNRAGAYSLRMDRQPVGARMRGVSTTPKVVNTSARIQQLERDVTSGARIAVDAFWREVEGKGPLVESVKGREDEQLVTFIWREIFETHNVLVGWPMAVLRGDDYYMTHLPNTDVWYKTIQIRRGSRFSYWLAPNYRNGDFLFTARLDPLNPLVFPDDSGSFVDVNSVLDTPGAPDAQWYSRTPVKRGTVATSRFISETLKNGRDMWVYTPPGYSRTAAALPLLVLFDGSSYVDAGSNNATTTLDNLINDGRIRPVVVCFLNSVDRAVDLGYEGADALGDAIVDDCHDYEPIMRSAPIRATSPLVVRVRERWQRR